ncbi:response regulator transcription factor [Herbivorax sp. ANBcel31]|uniref:response regulator n=1 Tax=Herbivorax sp. ANBcel31 TaxID=3069754 RepID=UPI0027B7DCC0|nr:response regulator transcription factor [Herbivorax sp. ANBcel31]MDQ2087643.1 response regulator transcription factor [Herbivorax sp. ANBcel31]
MDKIGVVIADDHAMVRQGLKQILELENDIAVIAQASNGEEALSIARDKTPDVILMDINMPGMNGLQAIKEIKDEKISSRVIVLTIHEDREYLFKTLHMGAEGYVLKDADPNVLIEAIRSVNNGQSYIQANMTKELVKEFTRVTLNENRKGEENNLTSREREVLELIAEGMINKEIATKLYISEKTVKNHVSNIFKKLKVSDRTQAAIYAYKNNITI